MLPKRHRSPAVAFRYCPQGRGRLWLMVRIRVFGGKLECGGALVVFHPAKRGITLLKADSDQSRVIQSTVFIPLFILASQQMHDSCYEAISP